MSSQISISDSDCHQASSGVAISTGANLRFTSVSSNQSQGDGWNIGSSGKSIALVACEAHGNNLARGTAYDVHITSTGHVGLFGFSYASGGVTDARLHQLVKQQRD